ncbi:isoflavone reductase family protein [Colletotrichum karsti]|uniref:Isoflavone reductase family protein n=1 Tax=Colletotrichum karsti TaxID=1095194 RepID=A0A9P6LM70_9PEZI|nr:isoflavone reductase family protein [Colletotrichum karsti]KAF9881189.1 isoflavone reductase family protein [Colletotrichum karsti]
MAPQIKNVAVAGAGGNVGTPVVKALMDTNKFNITILTRKAEGHNFPSGATVKEVDYDSLDSLTSALQGQDALVNATSSFDPKAATRVVDACIAAGVYRYIPPDFGIDPVKAHVPELPVFGIKGMTHKYMQAKTQETGDKFTWSIIANGPFLDWGIRSTFMGFDAKRKRITYHNDGENVVPYTNLGDVGRAVVGTLLHPDETANRIVYVHTVNKSQKQLAALAKEAIGGEWEETTMDVDVIYASCMESIKKGILTPDVMIPQILYACTKKQYAAPWEKSDNALLGVKEWSDEDVKQLFKTVNSE